MPRRNDSRCALRADAIPSHPRVFMRDRVRGRVAAFSGREARWHDEPAGLGHVALLALIGLVALNLLAVAPIE